MGILILSVVTVISLIVGVRQARRGRITAHRWTMLSLFVFALIVTGAFTLLPGRAMHMVIIGS